VNVKNSKLWSWWCICIVFNLYENCDEAGSEIVMLILLFRSGQDIETSKTNDNCSVGNSMSVTKNDN